VEAVGLTTNKKKLGLPGNIVLDKDEAGLEESIVNVANVLIIKISNLNEYLGSLSEARVEEIKNGIEFLNKITAR
ncbi:type II toxin-antitoxin system PemK/MazF family toxin, partial [Candidatus Dojkabacteria bacterium]|nr:type II toxin-antitoxin system PemK/MazF family toxin [Candidatus Dojkabacteria bacterium]